MGAYAIDTKESHKIGVYSIECGVCVKDRTGAECVYYDVQAVKLKTEDGGFQLFAKGEAAETTVIPNFASGNMEVEPEEGKLFNKVTIEKPTNLTPENIMKDVEIAGVVGTAEGGGGATMTYYENNDCVTIMSNSYRGMPFESAKFTAVKRLETQAFTGCNNLKKADFTNVEYIGYGAFWCGFAPVIEHIIIRSTTKCELDSSNPGMLYGFGVNTKVSIYVPSNLISAYKSDANWSLHANCFKAIEDYPDICG